MLVVGNRNKYGNVKTELRIPLRVNLRLFTLFAGEKYTPLTITETPKRLQLGLRSKNFRMVLGERWPIFLLKFTIIQW